MNLTIFTREYPPVILGGVGNTAKYLATELANKDYTVNIITPKFGKYSNLPSIEKEKNITVYRLPIKERLLFWYKSAFFSYLNRKIMRKTDLIHILNMRDAPFIYKKCPMISNVNDYYPLEVPFNFLKYPYPEKGRVFKTFHYQLFKFLDWTSLKRSDFIIYNSNYTKDKVSEGYNLKEKESKVIYKGIDANEFKSKVKYKKEIDILFAGSPLSTKGAKEFIYAVRLLKKKHPNLNCVMLGRPSKVDIDYLKLIKNLGLEKNIRFGGYADHNQSIKYYLKSTIYPFPSYREAFGQTLLEAMAAKIPIVTTKVGGIPEVVTEKEGFRVEPMKVEPIAEKISYLLENPKVREEMGASGYERVKKKFNFKKMIKEYFNVYKKYE